MATGSVKGAWLNQRYQIKDHDDPTERRKKTNPRKTNSILTLKLEVKKKREIRYTSEIDMYTTRIKMEIEKNHPQNPYSYQFLTRKFPSQLE